ncbi:MAG: hypothetical protein ABWY04_10340 [Arthrobacter sp.]
MRTRNTRLRQCLSAAAVVLALVCAPVTAHAAFTSVSQAKQLVSAGVMSPPAAATVTCERQGFLWWAQSVITVSSYSAVLRANYYDVKIFNPDETLVHTGDLSTAAGRTATQSRNAGTWKYEIRAHYKVPGSTNTWSGLPLKGEVRCT